MNKKAIMVKFLVTILIALIVFVPTCMFVSNFFRVSQQAQENFYDFSKAVKELEVNPQPQPETVLLILDDETSVVYFEPDQDKVGVNVEATGLIPDKSFAFVNPEKCAPDKGCLCLFSNTEVKDDSFEDSSADCKEINLPITLDNCGVGKGNNVESYTCTGGFIIERGLIKSSTALTSSYYEAPRRISLHLTKEKDGILIES